MGPPGGRPAPAEQRAAQFPGHQQTTHRVAPLPPDEHSPNLFPGAVSSSLQEGVYIPPNNRHPQQPPQSLRPNHQNQQNQQTVNNFPNDPTRPFRDPLLQVDNQIPDSIPHSREGNISGTQNIPDQVHPGEDSTDSPGRAGLHTHVRVDVSTEQEVCESTEEILTTFICGRMEYDGHNVPPGLSKRCQGRESAVAVVLRRMGDDISRNYELNHYISEIQVTPNTAYKTFASVAWQIFKDGNINWGRVVMLFYFAYKLALQVLNQLPLIEIVIEWVTRFISEKIASWISRQGGWSSIREYYGSTTGQMVGVFLAGIIVSSLFWYWRK